MLIIQKLTLDQISLFKQYAYPKQRSKLQEMVENPKHAVLRATMFNQPAGLLIAYRYDQESVYVVESIFVAAKFRNMGVATRLFQALIENSNQIYIDYFANLPEMSYLEKALNKAGFDHPQMHSMYFKTDITAHALAPWIRSCKPSPEFQMLPWKHMTEQQRKDLEEKRYFDYPQWLSPFIQEEVIQASVSLVLQRNDGVIMGWIIYHRHVEHAVLCRSLFIAESLQDSGLGLSMIGLSVYRMLEANIPSLVFQVDPNNRRMLRVVEKMIMPYYRTEQSEFRQARFIRKQPL
jgi:GNAT superfamily N-acetyltransferase